jgi:hypothetical protein
MIDAKVIKVKNISDKDEAFMWIHTGDVFYGKINKWPEVGESFCLNENNSRYSLRTTPVTEIINDREFKTLNSIYKIITKSDERDEKIKNILE